MQYQQGLAQSCIASDFAEGAIGASGRLPILDEDSTVVRPGEPIPCVNETETGTGIPSVMLWRLLDSLSLPSETTLHGVRWSSDFQGTYFWDPEISGTVPFNRLKSRNAGAEGHRQPAMYFPRGGSTIARPGKGGRLLWARSNYEAVAAVMHVGIGRVVELPEAESYRRWKATLAESPLLRCTLDGMGGDQLMAGHRSNHLPIAYVPDDQAGALVCAFIAQATTQGIRVFAAGINVQPSNEVHHHDQRYCRPGPALRRPCHTVH